MVDRIVRPSSARRKTARTHARSLPRVEELEPRAVPAAALGGGLAQVQALASLQQAVISAARSLASQPSIVAQAGAVHNGLGQTAVTPGETVVGFGFNGRTLVLLVEEPGATVNSGTPGSLPQNQGTGAIIPDGLSPTRTPVVTPTGRPGPGQTTSVVVETDVRAFSLQVLGPITPIPVTNPNPQNVPGPLPGSVMPSAPLTARIERGGNEEGFLEPVPVGAAGTATSPVKPVIEKLKVMPTPVAPDGEQRPAAPETGKPADDQRPERPGLPGQGDPAPEKAAGDIMSNSSRADHDMTPAAVEAFFGGRAVVPEPTAPVVQATAREDEAGSGPVVSAAVLVAAVLGERDTARRAQAGRRTGRPVN